MLTLDELRNLAADYREQAARVVEEAEELERQIAERERFMASITGQIT
jgi:hypothetical protein